MSERKLIAAPDMGIVFSSTNTGVMMTTTQAPPKVKPVMPLPEERGTEIIMPWGAANDFPQVLAADARKSTIIPATLDKVANFIYAGGIHWGHLTYKDNGKEVFMPQMEKPSTDPVRRWLRENMYEAQLMKLILNFVWFRMVFVELILSPDRSRIVQFYVHQSKNVRYGWPGTDGMVKYAYISADWPNSDETKAIKVPVLDPLYNPVFSLQNRTDSLKYIYPISYPDVDNDYYHLVDWNSARTSKWLAFAHKIPEFKEALMKNQISIKYHIQFSADFWTMLYPKWNTGMTPTEQVTAKETTLKDYNDKMVGAENAGRSILSVFNYGPTGQIQPGIIITTIDDKIKDGIYIEDSQEASTHILNSIGFDPSITGNGPGKGFGAGSGSDKRVGFDIAKSLIISRQDLALQFLGLVRDYNGFDADLIFRFRNSLITTLDTGAGTKAA